MSRDFNSIDKLCLALDGIHTLEEVEKRVLELRNFVGTFKVGSELFTRFGPRVVEIVKKYERSVFLDLKLHDIPATVKNTSRVIAEMGVDMFTVHASGGSRMIMAARMGIREGSEKNKNGDPPPRILGVTLLTSLDKDDLDLLRFHPDHARTFASLADVAGIDSLVCPVQEIESLKKVNKDFFFVTPGIRTTSDFRDDQRQVATPSKAIKLGSDLLVVGRAINQYRSPQERKNAAIGILFDINKGLEGA